MKKAPLFILIVASALLFSLFGFIGRNDIYDYQGRTLLTEPYFKGMFLGFNKGMYPWVLYNDEVRSVARAAADERKLKEATLKAKAANEIEAKEETESNEEAVEESISKAESKAVSTPSPTPTPIPEPTYVPRYEPLRESSYDEYINHISADIYGSDGVNFALGYSDYKSVSEDYFDGALFIGDSRTVGLRNYTDLSEHADFLCETSLTIWKVLSSNFGGRGTVEENLELYSYDKIYIMVGVNELGTGTTEDYMKEFTAIVDRIHELAPNAIIYIQSIMNVDKEKSTTDPIFNNTNIMGRNNAIATLADNETIFYLNINESVCDEEGYLRDDLRGDHLHLMGASNEYWKEYLCAHAVIRKGDEKYIVEPVATPTPTPTPTATMTPTPSSTPSEKPTEAPTAAPVEESTEAPSEATKEVPAVENAQEVEAVPVADPVQETQPAESNE